MDKDTSREGEARTPDRMPVGLWLVRGLAIFISIVLGIAAGGLFLQYGSGDGLQATDWIRSGLICASTFWLAWGAMGGFLGLVTWRPAKNLPVSIPALMDRPLSVASDRSAPHPAEGMTAILVPVYNEDPVTTYARIAAMDASLAALGVTERFHFAILSDTRNDDVAAQERTWFLRLIEERNGEGRIFYRRRTSNIGRKAGNIEDFFTRSGGAYEFALILDADSLMEGATIVEMVRRMQADPNLGLLQSLPKVIEAHSRFGRSMQFSASFYSPIFAHGLARMQGKTGPFWGHNAVVRTRAFTQSCGLPALAGDPPFGGHILSHDYVEAALLARAGWTVRLDDDMEGSFEEGPENIVDFAKRDRRWCQGNLQHSRLIMSPRLKMWSRFVFLQNVLSYIAPLFWLGFIFASAAAIVFQLSPNYFPDPLQQLFPVFPYNETRKALELAVGIFSLLVAPKLLIAIHAGFTGRAKGFGGGLTALRSTVTELLFSSLIAPIMLMYQTRSVFQVVFGLDGGWPPNRRGDGTMSLAESWAASRWISMTGAAVILLTFWLTPSLVLWLLPVGLPMLFAPQIIAWSSRTGRHRQNDAETGADGPKSAPQPRSRRLFTAPTELATPPVVHAWETILTAWTAPADIQADTGEQDHADIRPEPAAVH